LPLVRPDLRGFDPDGASTPDAGIYGLSFTEAESSVVLVPVPWDATTSYRPGTADGWRAILAASHQVDLLLPELGELGLTNPWQYGIHLQEPAPEVIELNRKGHALVGHGAAERARAAVEVDRLSAEVDRIVRERVEAQLAVGKLVGVIGGEHSVSFGAIAAHAERHPGLGLLQVDAHADLRHAYEGFAHSHASVMDNVLAEIPVASLTQVGVRDLCAEELDRIRSEPRIHTFFEADLRRRRFAGESWKGQCEAIVATLPGEVYVSFDIDGLDPALCPSTGTPVPGGLGFAEAAYLLEALARAGRRVVGFDLTEVAPAPGGGDEWDGNVAARLLYRLIAVALLGHGAHA